MKKLMSFIVKLAAVVGFIAGLYYLYENYFKKDNDDEEMDESDFDDFDFDDVDVIKNRNIHLKNPLLFCVLP